MELQMEHLYHDDAYLKSCEAEVVSADAAGIRLTRTVFYPTGGGQPGDRCLMRISEEHTTEHKSRLNIP